MASPHSYLFDEDVIRDALKRHDPNGPIYVALFFRYRTTANYPKDALQEFHDLPSCSGQEAMMQRYLPEVMEEQAANGFEQTVIHGGPLIGVLHATNEEHWDDVWIVKMGRFQNWANMIFSDHYKTSTWPHCAAACDDLKALLLGAHPLP